MENQNNKVKVLQSLVLIHSGIGSASNSNFTKN